MKIYKGQGPVLHEAGKHMSKSGPRENEFKKILNQVSSRPEENKTGADEVNSVPIARGVGVPGGIENIGSQFNIPDKKEMIGALKETLDLVDFYAGKLGDSSQDITGLEPLIGHLEDRLETLRQMGSAPGIPEKLGPVISDMTITIGAEITKFKRGDYQ